MSHTLPGATLGGLPTTVRLDVGQYLALWRHLRLGHRHVLLDPTDHGRTYAARDAADAAAWARLAAQGLLDGRGLPDPLLADALGVLAAPTLEIDLTVVTAGRRSASVAVARGSLALVASDDVGLRLDPADPADLAGAVLAPLPDRRAAPGVPMAVPAGPVLDEDLTPAERAPALRRAGVPRHTVDRLAAIWAEPPERAAQLGVTVRDHGGHRHRGPRVITVLDTVPGRLVVEREPSTGRVVYRPTDRARLRPELADLLERHRRRVVPDSPESRSALPESGRVPSGPAGSPRT